MEISKFSHTYNFFFFGRENITALFSQSVAAGEPQIEAVYDGTSILGEGPVYDEAKNELIWVDIEGRSINFIDLSTKTNRSLTTSAQVGAAVPGTNGKRLIASIGKKLVLVDRDTGILWI